MTVWEELSRRIWGVNQEKRLQQLISKVTYKPGVTIKLDKRTNTSIALIFTWQTKDTRNGLVEVPLMSTEYYSFKDMESLSDAQIFAKIRRQVHEMELHEADEWLKFEDKPIKDPHS